MGLLFWCDGAAEQEDDLPSSCSGPIATVITVTITRTSSAIRQGDHANSWRGSGLTRTPGMQVIPMENEAGRGMVEGGTLCERKNARGVDTNRNWDIHWGFREKDYDPSEEFPGHKPFRWDPLGVLE